MLTQDKRRPAIIFGAGGGLLLLGAIVVFFTRPGFSSIDDRAALLAPEAAGAAEASYRAAGMNICHIDETRSRITVSNINDVPLKWSAIGCVNDRTQFGHSGARWSRSSVPNSEDTIDIRNFEQIGRASCRERVCQYV